MPYCVKKGKFVLEIGLKSIYCMFDGERTRRITSLSNTLAITVRMCVCLQTMLSAFDP